MRLLLGVTLGLVVWGSSAQAQATPARPTPAVTTWEYSTVLHAIDATDDSEVWSWAVAGGGADATSYEGLAAKLGVRSNAGGQMVALLNWLGTQGWELVGLT